MYALFMNSKKEEKLEKIGLECINIFKNVSLLANEMNIDSNLSLCNLYSYLLYTGNLSIDKEFRQSSDKIVNDGFANIALGYGCCRNICDGLSTLLRLNMVENCELTTKFNPNTIFSNYDPIFKDEYDMNKIKTKVDRVFSSFKPYDIKSSHALNLVVEDNRYFVYDATWCLILKIKGPKLKVINGAGRMKIVFSEDDRILQTKRYLKQLEHLDSYNFDTIRELSEMDFIKFNDNSKLINSFYSDAHSNIESIYKILKQ